MKAETKKRTLAGQRNSRSFKMTGVRQVPDRVQFDVRAGELVDEQGGAFERKFQRALRSAAKEIVVNLGASGQLSSAALGVLLRARADANRGGSSFTVIPENEEVAGFLGQLGLDSILGLAAGA